MRFTDLLARARPNYEPPRTLLALDPGETLGYAVFIDGDLDSWGQIELLAEDKTIMWEPLIKLFESTKPDALVCENYRVYQHKLKEHSNSEIVTLRFIGGIDLLWYLRQSELPIIYQMASMAKGFCKDEKLKKWGYWKEGMKHSRDAIRHGCYYLLFNDRNKDVK